MREACPLRESVLVEYQPETTSFALSFALGECESMIHLQCSKLIILKYPPNETNTSNPNFLYTNSF